jgi:hypothetical protein
MWMFLFAAVGCADPALAATVRSGHPRLWINTDNIQTFRDRIASSHQGEWNSLIARLENELAHPPVYARKSDFGWDEGGSLIFEEYAFAYLMTGHTRYATRAIQLLYQAKSIVSPTSSDANEFYMHHVAVAYDWLYDVMTPTQRSELGSDLLTRVKTRNITTTTDMYHGRDRKLRGPLFGALALHGAGIDDLYISDRLGAYAWFQDNYYNVLDEIAFEGSWYVWSAYAGRSDPAVTQNVEAWRTATTDRNPYLQDSGWTAFPPGYTPKPGIDWLTNKPLQSMYVITPTFKGMMHGDTGNCTYCSITALTIAPLIQVHRDPVAHWWLEQLIIKYGLPNLYKILWWDKSVPKTPPPEAGTPRVRFFQDLGQVFFKSGWNYGSTSQDLWGRFHVNRTSVPINHYHLDQGHFSIMRGNDRLAINAGLYDDWPSAYRHNYYANTSAHNTLIINNKGQIRMDTRGQDQVGRATEPARSRGQIDRFKDHPDYAYAFGNLTKAYPSTDVTNATRQFVYLKDAFYLIYDRVGTPSPSAPKEWLLHMIDKPTVNSTLTVREGTATSGILESTNSDLVTITRGASKLFSKTLLPSSPGIRLIGGGPLDETGYHAYVEGTRYRCVRDDAGTLCRTSDFDAQEAGYWRAEVYPTIASAETVFCTSSNRRPIAPRA